MNRPASDFKTFSIATLGCKVNQYESDQISALLLSHGLTQVDAAGDLQIVNTCSVTVQAASKSRQTVRRAGKAYKAGISLPVLPSNLGLADHALANNSATAVLDEHPGASCETGDEIDSPPPGEQPIEPFEKPVSLRIVLGKAGHQKAKHDNDGNITGDAEHPDSSSQSNANNNDEDVETSSPDVPFRQPQIIVTGCWATSDPQAAAKLPGVKAVITHHDDVMSRLKDFLNQILPQGNLESDQAGLNRPQDPPNPNVHSQPLESIFVNEKIDKIDENLSTPGHSSGADPSPDDACSTGTINLPLLSNRQKSHQRAFLKIQDGCDAHCTYCIIPQLRPKLWSKPIADCVEEAKRMVEVGHDEIVLTGIFMGAYGQPTALRRFQQQSTAIPLGELITALCTQVNGLKRLRLSSLEPGDLNPDLLSILKSHRQVVPHFHLPLQSGSDHLLKRMNRQYNSADFLQMVEQVQKAFDRPALTTDIIVGFPGESDEEFQKTMHVARQSGFIHIHAFSYSARPKTAAARWKKDFVHGPVVNERIHALNHLASQISFDYRKQFLGESVELLVEKPSDNEAHAPSLQHGRCERYFPVHFNADQLLTGELRRAKITEVTEQMTLGELQ